MRFGIMNRATVSLAVIVLVKIWMQAVESLAVIGVVHRLHQFMLIGK